MTGGDCGKDDASDSSSAEGWVRSGSDARTKAPLSLAATDAHICLAKDRRCPKPHHMLCHQQVTTHCVIRRSPYAVSPTGEHTLCHESRENHHFTVTPEGLTLRHLQVTTQCDVSRSPHTVSDQHVTTRCVKHQTTSHILTSHRRVRASHDRRSQTVSCDGC